MTVSTSFRDEELTAYLDDELDAATRQSVDTALRSDPALQQRLDGLRIPRDAVSEAFNQVQSAAPSDARFTVDAAARLVRVCAQLGSACGLPADRCGGRRNVHLG